MIMIAHCFIGLLCTFVLSSYADAQKILRNHVQNPSFEYTEKDTVRHSPDESWTFKTEYDSVTGHVTASRAIDGFRSYLIRAEKGSGFLESDPFKVERRKRYLLSFGVCGDGHIETQILWWREETDSLYFLEIEYLDTIEVSDTWSVPEFYFTSPRRASAASIRLTVFDGQVWIDDVRFR
jgi:hypothetical protein